MPRSTLSLRERAGAMTLVGLVHVGVLAGLLMLKPSTATTDRLQEPLEIFDIPLSAPPPPPPVVVDSSPAPEDEGAAAPPARTAQAAPVERPDPIVQLPTPPPPIVTAPLPGTGNEPSAGAAPVDGLGSGAGGQGDGTGSGNGGTGPGGGGGEPATRPSLASRPLTQRDFSSASRRAWPSGGRVLVTFNVEVNGRASDCRIFQSIGNPDIDAEACALVLRKLRFRPARDESGRPVLSRYAYAQSALF